MIPTSLYIHVPWCIRKCPYCDFNSHKSPQELPEQQYIQALLNDLKQDLIDFPQRQIISIFIGGGTPSLLSASAYACLLEEIGKLLPLSEDIEITMEANPGTVEQQRFRGYREAGINRLSLGIQSFNPEHLKKLGRIHDDKQAHFAIETARRAGFDNINLDLMHGLPGQTIEQGLADLQQALQYEPEHLSWYQLTLEPNTVFYKQRPVLPEDDEIALMEEQGFALLQQSGYQRYEISAFSKKNRASRHNLNYWLFGDYFGIGAGAHGKITQDLATPKIVRTNKYRQPTDYLNKDKPFCAGKESIDADSLLFEFFLNTTRLEQTIPLELFTERTGLSKSLLLDKLKKASELKLITLQDDHWQVSPLGRQFTNNLQELFLP
ncbi:radical SAM family heme chaperone HemW [Legionella sp. 16cNR16C]|uniref:radical SAM family heme chaperone HemW n=1 Tax=Legionella sp. 16cNR16C TaxID=2905656 RepID=UPI001E4475D3|nr:radical SAM family heme chaperone HemW [Legionella sp. 16cNR16C]MCE3045688.1 radical SAM family heme chaperone HemW [Legionella sp. 16cNR16C]